MPPKNENTCIKIQIYEISESLYIDIIIFFMGVQMKKMEKNNRMLYDYFVIVFNFLDKLDFFLEAVFALITPFVQA